MLRILGYLKATREFDLKISYDKMSTLTWYVDGSYAVHEDIKGHSGALLIIG